MHQSRRSNRANKPKILAARDISSVAGYMKSKDCKNVMMMLGAGVSTSAGIPDFRSPETGLYSNLARLNLPHPEAVFEINFFRRNPVPFYTLAHELYPGKFRPTITHSFIRLLAEKGLLHTCFTQNIDTLERRAGVPEEKIIEAHGSFATQRCIDCSETFDDNDMKRHILQKKIARCVSCGGYVKPDIVFFGEALPEIFIRAVPNLRKADLLIVMGTSLTVQPFASLAERVDDSCPRVLINLDHVGSFGSRSDDVALLGKCDEVVRDLCKELGWDDELNQLWDETEASVITDKQPVLKVNSEEPSEKSDTLKEIEKQFASLDLDSKDGNNGPSAENLTPGPPSESKDKAAALPPKSVTATENKENAAGGKVVEEKLEVPAIPPAENKLL
ncbi:hypothetical protein HYPSUDRAFT_40027 [Hypholoma sublateritium FD-334 SS-4]|uniref:NAD-dependent protein deacetylase n=1 Tax=Hypholoma sublateritium (strain FD-334 SS-4) TaxID=945553 RepID=A0A0D2NWU3_HYPSF|nr:hypothetical protein HYPSUDRAFT_40027 [Hypholoma sublateritium FD-334 SS-4]